MLGQSEFGDGFGTMGDTVLPGTGDIRSREMRPKPLGPRTTILSEHLNAFKHEVFQEHASIDLGLELLHAFPNLVRAETLHP